LDLLKIISPVTQTCIVEWQHTNMIFNHKEMRCMIFGMDIKLFFEQIIDRSLEGKQYTALLINLESARKIKTV